MKRKPYYKEIDTKGCSKCKHERSWMIIDPNGIGSSSSWFDEEFVDDLVDMLNRAYTLGKLSA